MVKKQHYVMSFAKNIFATAAKQYQSIVRSRVAAIAQHEDLFLESDDVEKALNRIPTKLRWLGKCFIEYS